MFKIKHRFMSVKTLQVKTKPFNNRNKGKNQENRFLSYCLTCLLFEA